VTDISFLGLLRRGDKVVFGTDSVLREIRAGSAAIVIIATDMSDRIADDIAETARHNHIKVMRRWTKQEIGAAIGRGDVGVVAITDRAAAAKIQGGA